MSAYTLQQQLLPAREAVQKLLEQMSAIRQYLSAAGEGGSLPLTTADRVSARISQVQGQVNRPLAAAANVQGAMDGYAGLPTAAQLKQLDWAWEDAVTGVTALNRVIQQDMPPVYAAIGSAVKWPEVRAVTVPVRPALP